ncbi:SPATS1 isoform 4 [Pan troglodytes]|uniref:SPATS1 isoform 4 n=1 Tax=Pan troglodytes TaxID=9598 RepID=A0A2J8P0K7_PANTR|nr:SPATS1 isoform 4 [Pan troglodytes]
MSPSMLTGNGPRGCRLPSISSATCGRQLEKVPEKRDSGMTEVERTYNLIRQRAPPKQSLINYLTGSHSSGEVYYL